MSSIGLQTSSFWNFGWQLDAEANVWLRTDAGQPNFDGLSGDRISARSVIVQVVEQDVLVGENDPGGFPRRYQHLIGSGDGVLYVGGRGPRCALVTADPVGQDDLDLRGQRRPGRPAARSGLVGDRAGRQRHQRGLRQTAPRSVVSRRTLVVTLVWHRRQEGVHRPPNLMIGIE